MHRDELIKLVPIRPGHLSRKDNEIKVYSNLIKFPY